MSHLFETTLLTTGSIPDPIEEQVRQVEEDQSGAIPSIAGRLVIGEEDGAMTITHWNTGHVPEDEHEAPFLVEDVPLEKKKIGWLVGWVIIVKRL